MVKIMTALICAMTLFIGISLTACEKEGPVERAGEAVEDAGEKVGEALKDAGDKVD